MRDALPTGLKDYIASDAKFGMDDKVYSQQRPYVCRLQWSSGSNDSNASTDDDEANNKSNISQLELKLVSSTGTASSIEHLTVCR